MKNTGGMYVLTYSYSNADWAARDSRARDCHYRIKNWLLRAETTAGQKNVAHPDLGGKSKIYLPPAANQAWSDKNTCESDG